MLEKVCRICGVTRPIDEFYRASASRDGRRGECIPCAKEIRRRHYLENRERYIERSNEWQSANADRHRAYQAEYRQRPERKRLMRDAYYRRTFGLSADDVDALIEAQGGVCAI